MNIENRYDLHLLGWYSFQQLCLSITREILGQTVEIYLDTNDGGRDGAFSGIWAQQKQEDLNGQFVIQCKFTNKKDSRLRLSDIADELKKAGRLVKEGRCDCYILISNTGITGKMTEKITQAFLDLGIKQIKIYGTSWICNQIHESNRLRMLVPRVYGLGDLSQILDERAYSQARQLLASMRDDLAKIVITKAYSQAVNALNKYGYVLLVGEAAAGKTTIASMLAMGALDQWKAHTLKLDLPSKVIEHWNPDSPSQFFWIDDAFGVTQYESGLAKDWNHIFPQVKSMLNQGVKIVMTTRDYIYKRARNDLKTAAFPLLNESQVVIDVHNLTLSEKEQILYNHLKLGQQESTFVSEVKPFLGTIAKHPRFIPETARRLADPAFTKSLVLYEHTLSQFVNKQEGFLKDVISGLDQNSKAALGLIYMNNDQLLSPLALNEQEKIAIERLGSTAGGCIEALDSMNGSLVQLTTIDDNPMWRFKHPTIGDAYSIIVAKSPDLLEIYLRGTSVEKLLEQITCGNVGLEKAIVVGKGLYHLILERLKKFTTSKDYKSSYMSEWGAKRQLYTFLSRRCSKDFLKLYLENNQDLIEAISNPNPSFSWSADISLVIQLNKLALFPEDKRKSLVDYVSEIAINGEDLFILENKEFQSIFSEEELASLVNNIREKLLPELSSVRRNWESNFYQNDQEAEEYMDGYIEILNALKNHFEEDDNIDEIIQKEKGYAGEWVDENTQIEKPTVPERILSKADDDLLVPTSRNIFDDIDC